VGDAVSQFQRQKKLVCDALGLTEKVFKIVDTDVWNVPAPGSSGIHTLKWERGGEAPHGDRRRHTTGAICFIKAALHFLTRAIEE